MNTVKGDFTVGVDRSSLRILSWLRLVFQAPCPAANKANNDSSITALGREGNSTRHATFRARRAGGHQPRRMNDRSFLMATEGFLPLVVLPSGDPESLFPAVAKSMKSGNRSLTWQILFGVSFAGFAASVLPGFIQQYVGSRRRPRKSLARATTTPSTPSLIAVGVRFRVSVHRCGV